MGKYSLFISFKFNQSTLFCLLSSSVCPFGSDKQGLISGDAMPVHDTAKEQAASKLEAARVDALPDGVAALARSTGADRIGKTTRGVCKRCGEEGHLAHQCFNFLTKKNEIVCYCRSCSL